VHPGQPRRDFGRETGVGVSAREREGTMTVGKTDRENGQGLRVDTNDILVQEGKVKRVRLHGRRRLRPDNHGHGAKTDSSNRVYEAGLAQG
jgi:hypothetical protein